MAYDAANEVTSVQEPYATILTFTYDANGRRSSAASTSVCGGTRRFCRMPRRCRSSSTMTEKQQEVLALLTRRHQQEFLLLTNLVSKYAKQESEKGKEVSA